MMSFWWKVSTLCKDLIREKKQHWVQILFQILPNKLYLSGVNRTFLKFLTKSQRSIIRNAFVLSRSKLQHYQQLEIWSGFQRASNFKCSLQCVNNTNQTVTLLVSYNRQHLTTQNSGILISRLLSYSMGANNCSSLIQQCEIKAI